MKYGAGFGYDFGIYRNYINGYFDRLGDPTVVPFGFSAFSNMLRLLGSSTDQILFGWYFVLSVMILVALYCVVKNYFNAKTAFIAVILFATSITQFEFHWWYYYRNFLALFLCYCHSSLSTTNHFLTLALLFIGIVHPPSLIHSGCHCWFIYLSAIKKRENFVIKRRIAFVSF